MKKVFALILAVCIGLTACERRDIGGGFFFEERLQYMGCTFIICDKDGNNVCMQEDFNIDELSLEYNGKIYKPSKEYQRVDENSKYPPSYKNSIYFGTSPHTDMGYPVYWLIYGDLRWGKNAEYIVRYKDNEWHLYYKTWPLKGDGSPAQHELWVNGEKVEEVLCFMLEDHPDYADESEREVWLYPLYVE